MKRLLFVPVLVLLLAGCKQAATEKTFSFEGNPLMRDCYTADLSSIQYLNC